MALESSGANLDLCQFFFVWWCWTVHWLNEWCNFSNGQCKNNTSNQHWYYSHYHIYQTQWRSLSHELHGLSDFDRFQWSNEVVHGALTCPYPIQSIWLAALKMDQEYCVIGSSSISPLKRTQHGPRIRPSSSSLIWVTTSGHFTVMKMHLWSPIPGKSINMGTINRMHPLKWITAKIIIASLITFNTKQIFGRHCCWWQFFDFGDRYSRKVEIKAWTYPVHWICYTESSAT